MSFLAPWALVWLGSIPVLLWLWRLSSTKRQVRVSSLIPFERLLKRAPKRRTRLVVTLLFWLQLAILLGLILAVSRPMVFQRRARTILVVLDTSASMDAGGTFEQAKAALLTRLARKGPTDQAFVMTTSPVAPLTPRPTSDTVALTRAAQALHPTHLGGNLSTTAHIGRVLLGAEPDETMVVTDEARPEALPRGVQWVTVGRPAPNVAIVGLDAVGPLCSASGASVVVTIQNFSEGIVPVAVSASQGIRRLAEASADFGPRERRSLSLAIPGDVEGQVEVSVAARGDSLSADNRAWFSLRRTASLPVVIRSSSAAFTQTLSRWLGACEALTWSANTPRTDGTLVITDSTVPSHAAAALVFSPPAEGKPVLNYWVVSSGHPIGSYLAPVEAVAASLNLATEASAAGIPVVAALMNGRKVPVVIAEEREGRRMVTMRLNPTSSEGSTPVLLAFFNSLRWLLGRSEVPVVGEPLLVNGLAAGRVTVRRPDGTMDSVEASGDAVAYDAATLAGVYRLEQGPRRLTAAVNFFDPLESDLLHHPSTWRPLPAMPRESLPARRVAHPLSNLLMLAALALLLIEWWRYGVKRNPQSP